MCLDSLLANDYPRDRFEVLVLDGRSTDESADIVRNYAARDGRVRLLLNPKRTVPGGLNLGLRVARGEIIICMSAHVVCSTDFIRQCVTLLEETGAVNVGGVIHAVGTGYVGGAIALAVTSPFGVGDAWYRHANRDMWADTTFPGAWYKATLETLGGFNEEWEVNQDYELNYRLRRAGGRILVSPRIRCRYAVRNTLGGLCLQYFRYGMWRVKTIKAHPDSLRWRQLVPPTFVAALAVSLALLMAGHVFGAVLPALYGVAALAAAFAAVYRRGWRYFPLLPVVFACMHLSWGVGFWIGLVRFGIPRISLQSLVRAFRTIV
jgi:succinoglycan biosynthesis protein ExoA